MFARSNHFARIEVLTVCTVITVVTDAHVILACSMAGAESDVLALVNVLTVLTVKRTGTFAPMSHVEYNLTQIYRFLGQRFLNF